MEAALSWYRANDGFRKPLGPIRAPTLYVWGDADDMIGRIAAEGTQDFIAAPYRLEILVGAGHFVTDQVPSLINKMLLAHLAAHPA
jgi:pimeloyl-ACP methyl ester carboxylesterase